MSRHVLITTTRIQNLVNVGQILWIFTFGVQKKASKHPKCRKSTLKNKNFEKTKKVPRDNWKTFLKRVYNPKSKKNYDL